MNIAVKLLLLAAIAGSPVFGSSGAYAFSTADGIRGSDQRLLADVTSSAGTGDLGSGNGGALTATFRIPSGLAAAPDGTVFISDTRNHLIRKLADGQISSYAGILYKKDDKGFPLGGLLDGSDDLSLFQEPLGLAVDAQGSVYVADSANHAVRKIDASRQVTTLAGSGLLGNKDGIGREASFHRPSDVAVAPDGTVYVADTLNHLIRSISPAGAVRTLNAPSARVVELMPGYAVPAGDYADGPLANAKFNEPTALVMDRQGNLYVSDSGNQRIRYIDLAQGTVMTVAGGGTAEGREPLYVPGDYADGDALAARFHYPMGLALTAEGGLVIADSQNHCVRYLLNGKVSTLAGDPERKTGGRDGVESVAAFQRPADVAVLNDGSVLVADAYNNKLRHIELYRLPAGMPGGDQVKVALGGKWIVFDTQPEISEGRTMVPVRAITEALGYKVTFDEAAEAVQLSKDGVTIELYIGRTGIKRREHGREAVKTTDAAPYMKEGRTYVPIRFFAEEIGLDVQWDDATRTSILREKTAAVRF